MRKLAVYEIDTSQSWMFDVGKCEVCSFNRNLKVVLYDCRLKSQNQSLRNHNTFKLGEKSFSNIDIHINLEVLYLHTFT